MLILCKVPNIGAWLRQEARERRTAYRLETFRRNPAGNQSRPVEPGQQPETSLAWGRVTCTCEAWTVRSNAVRLSPEIKILSR